MKNFKVSIELSDGEKIEETVAAENPGDILEPFFAERGLNWGRISAISVNLERG